MPACFQLGRILLALVAQFLDILVAEQRVVVEIDLGIERQHIAGAGDDQRVDLDDRGVKLLERMRQRLDELGRDADLLAFEPEPVGDLAGMEGLEPGSPDRSPP